MKFNEKSIIISGINVLRMFVHKCKIADVLRVDSAQIFRHTVITIEVNHYY